MRVLLTGGAGYIGSITAWHLLACGHQVRVLDSLERGHRGAVPPGADLVVGSVGDRAALLEAAHGCDAVVHLAGLIDVAESCARPEMYVDANVRQPTVMLDALEDAGVRAFVFSSTAAVYGEPQEVPITEDAPTEPVNVYGATKLEFEQELLRREAAGKLRAVRFRYFNVAGATPDGVLGEAHTNETHIIPRILQSVLKGGDSLDVYGGDYPTRDGTCVRDYIHVVDLANAHLLGLTRLAEGGSGGVFNLGNGAGFTNLEVLEACSAATGVELKANVVGRREGDPAVLVASAAKATAELGWRPRYPELLTMVEHAWRWHVAHPRGYE